MEKVVAAAKGKPVVLVLLNGSALVDRLGRPERARDRRGLVRRAGRGHRGRRRALRQREPGRPPAPHLLPLARPASALRRLRDEGPHLPLLHRRSRSTPSATASATRASPTRSSPCPKKAAVGAPVAVSVEVQNAGAMAADEVVQLYVTDVEASGPVPLRALKGFQRVSLKPGEKRVVRFTLDERALLARRAGRPARRRARPLHDRGRRQAAGAHGHGRRGDDDGADRRPRADGRGEGRGAVGRKGCAVVSPLSA